MTGEWRDRVAIVTGASSGIGAALALALSSRGARVVLAARREERMSDVAARCASETLVVPCDVTVRADRERAILETLDRWGRIDLLVNNAGRGLYASFEKTAIADLRDLLELDFFSVFSMTQAVLPSFRAAGRGAILNVASTGGLVAHAENVSAYLAAKHAVVGLSRGLRRDLAGTGISVQVVCPHLTATDFFGVGVGAERMKDAAARLRPRMDSTEEVAEGAVAAIGDEPFVIFPTEGSRRAYERFRDVEEEA